MSDLSFNASVFIQNANARNFMLLLEDLRMDTYEGRFGCVVGGAGIGKSRVVKYFHTNAQETVYIESTNTWKTSSLSFLKDVCRELDIESPKGNRDWCFRAIVENLYDNPDTIILVDEADRLGNEGLEFARDITRITLCPIILIGEMRLLAMMQKNERVWTRTFAPVQFAPMKESDVIIYAQEAVGVNLSVEVAQILHRTKTRKTANGNYRVVKRALLYAIDYANAKKTNEITEEIAKAAIKSAVAWANKN